jgi:hypothetical protein
MGYVQTQEEIDAIEFETDGTFGFASAIAVGGE